MAMPFTQMYFAYGTLMDSKMMDSVLGHHVTGVKAFLPNYKKKYDGSYPYLEKSTSLSGSGVTGRLYQLTTADMDKLKAWETQYDLIRVRLSDGTLAWAFSKKSHPES